MSERLRMTFRKISQTRGRLHTYGGPCVSGRSFLSAGETLTFVPQTHTHADQNPHNEIPQDISRKEEDINKANKRTVRFSLRVGKPLTD